MEYKVIQFSKGKGWQVLALGVIGWGKRLDSAMVDWKRQCKRRGIIVK